LLFSHGYSFYDERDFRGISRDPAIIEASIKRDSSVNIVALVDRDARAVGAAG
jgi:hypothetical protein